MVLFASVGRHGQESQIKKSRMYDPLTTRKYPFFTSIRHLVCHLSARPALPTQGEAFGLCTGDFPLYGTVPRVFMPNGKRCKMSLGLELSLRASSLYAYGILCPGSLCLMANDVRCPWAWSCPCGPVPSTLMVYCAQGLYA